MIIDFATKQVSSKEDFLLAQGGQIKDGIPAVARFHGGCLFYQTTDQYQGVWGWHASSLGRLATRKERQLIFGTDRPFDGEEALVILCRKSKDLTLVSTAGLTKAECDSSFRVQLWRDSDYVKSCTASWAKRYRELFNHEAPADDGRALPGHTLTEADADTGESRTAKAAAQESTSSKPKTQTEDRWSALREALFAESSSADEMRPETERTWDDLAAERREFEALVAEMRRQGFTESSEVSLYIKRHQLGCKYRHIAGRMDFQNGADEWRLEGAIAPHWYARLCGRLGLSSRRSGAVPRRFRSYAESGF